MSLHSQSLIFKEKKIKIFIVRRNSNYLCIEVKLIGNFYIVNKVFKTKFWCYYEYLIKLNLRSTVNFEVEKTEKRQILLPK